MKYTPFCSVDIAFGSMRTLKDLIEDKKEKKKTAVICDRMTADIWEITPLIEKGVEEGRLAWLDKCPSNPTQREVAAALGAVGDLEPESIIAIGGGSSIDIGKAVSAFYYMFPGHRATEEMITDVLKSGSYKEPHRFIDITAVPSTAGTGSEVTQFATIWDVGNKAKYSIDTPFNYAKKAYMIPELTLSLPERLTLSTGLDALSHAMEAFWAKPSTYLVKDVALRAIDMIMTYLPKLLNNPGSLELRTAMTRAALLSGMAFARTRTTACHSIGYPITMMYGVEHGFACALTLDAVSKINREKTELSDMLFETLEKHGGLRKWLDDVCRGIVTLRLKDFGIPEAGIDEIVSGTFTKGRMDNNPVDITPEQVKEILLSIYEYSPETGKEAA
ncbi:MAG TPA: phosphonoacetaldehyde reductase [Candidatus Copromorpha excrementigallinarum]|uniref:Phosphonoacetaldehyde reductase n=1 Tax=Candidatus Allocopromorpha excrementigallinarum TaxID=2840742 RepID=A0A9D1L7V6_9FIRM|nr:phosphonoacetaldehyde reductase [Candidatus Copromorpha excrementigallinarum]